MLGSKIRNVRNALGVLAGAVTEDQWALLQVVRAELTDAADTADDLEAGLHVWAQTRPQKEAPHA